MRREVKPHNETTQARDYERTNGNHCEIHPRKSWPMAPEDLGIAAVGIGALGFSLAFISKKTGETYPRVENTADVLALLALVVVSP
jgi:hypothetical protein